MATRKAFLAKTIPSKLTNFTSLVSGKDRKKHENEKLRHIKRGGSVALRTTSKAQPINLLINNAGKITLPKQPATADGFEKPFEMKHLGHVALTAKLLPFLCK